MSETELSFDQHFAELFRSSYPNLTIEPLNEHYFQIKGLTSGLKIVITTWIEPQPGNFTIPSLDEPADIIFLPKLEPPFYVLTEDIQRNGQIVVVTESVDSLRSIFGLVFKYQTSSIKRLRHILMCSGEITLWHLLMTKDDRDDLQQRVAERFMANFPN